MMLGTRAVETHRQHAAPDVDADRRRYDRSVRSIDVITLVRKRTLPYAIESTISNLPKLRVLA